MTGVLVFIGGGLGSLLRYFVNRMILWQGIELPFATILVNLVGAFLLGYLSETMLQKFNLSESVRIGLSVGVLGGFTTFSTMSYEGLKLAQTKSFVWAVGYLGVSVILGFVFAYWGYSLGRN